MKDKCKKYIFSEKSELMVLAVFIILIMLSFLNIKYSSYLKYIGIIIVNIYSVFDIIIHGKLKKYKIDKKILFRILLIVSIMLVPVFIYKNIIMGMKVVISVFVLFITSLFFIPLLLKKIEFKKILTVVSFSIFFVLLICSIVFHDSFSISGADRLGSEKRFLAGFTFATNIGCFSFLGLVCNDWNNIFSVKKNIKKFFDIIKGLFFILLMILADTRTAMLLSILFLFLLFFEKKIWNYNKKRKYAIIIIFTLIIIFTFSIVLNIIPYEKINLLLSQRLNYWNLALNKLKNSYNIILGCGEFEDITMSNNYILIDNGYLKYIYQFGIIAFAFLLEFLLNLFKKIYKLKEQKQKWTILVFILLCSFFADCIVETHLVTWNLLSIMTYTFCGILILEERKNEN